MRPATASVLAQTALTGGMADWQIEQFLADLVGAGPQASGLDRRTFLKVLGMGTAGVAAALWVPGQKAILMPPERAVVVATVDDLAALRAAFPGPFMTNWHNPVTFGAMDPREAMRWLSDQEYTLVVERGRRILQHDASPPTATIPVHSLDDLVKEAIRSARAEARPARKTRQSGRR